jgi:predicted GNAT family acetyltransferase
MPAVLASGGPVEVEALVAGSRGALPRRFYGHILESHRDALERFYDAPALKPMSRMGLRRADYRPVSDPGGVERLAHRDTAAIMQLYQHYPDNFFEPAHLDTGLYFGVRDGTELVSVAGIHVLSESNDVAVIGNIVTHTEHRGRGLASRCVRQLLDELFERVGHVALNVQVGNEPAIACYRKFGFVENHRFLEGWAVLL